MIRNDETTRTMQYTKGFDLSLLDVSDSESLSALPNVVSEITQEGFDPFTDLQI